MRIDSVRKGATGRTRSPAEVGCGSKKVIA